MIACESRRHAFLAFVSPSSSPFLGGWNNGSRRLHDRRFDSKIIHYDCWLLCLRSSSAQQRVIADYTKSFEERHFISSLFHFSVFIFSFIIIYQAKMRGRDTFPVFQDRFLPYLRHLCVSKRVWGNPLLVYAKAIIRERWHLQPRYCYLVYRCLSP